MSNLSDVRQNRDCSMGSWLAAGNNVALKPSEFPPVSAGIMLPEVAEEFFDRPKVRVINPIGCVKTARMLATRAGGRLLKRTVMELGGFNPMIIFDDVDMDYSIRLSSSASLLERTNSLPAGDP